MTATTNCPLCQNEHGGSCTESPTSRDAKRFDCENCGEFLASGSLLAMLRHKTLSPIQRAAMSHTLRQSVDEGAPPPLLTTTWFDEFIKAAHLPTPGEQAKNAIRFIGDRVSATGEPVRSLPRAFYASIGAPNPRQAGKVLRELTDKKLLTGHFRPYETKISWNTVDSVDLTLDGWERYEAEKRGRFAGQYGFLALKFGASDENHEIFFRNHLKPGVEKALGYRIEDMRDAARAGVIDNLMREKIRDAAFVLADLTHDNFGAYWEAGYAEGLGKPVIYLCEKAKFDEKKTHFDTNHCVTVPWDTAEPDRFVAELVATLRNSLNLFPTS